MATSTPTSPPSNVSPTQPNGRPMQRAPLPASKLGCKTTFTDEFYSVRPGLPTWMAGKRRHEKKQNASKKSRMQALPHVIEKSMTEEERGAYLNERDMGEEDF